MGTDLELMLHQWTAQDHRKILNVLEESYDEDERAEFTLDESNHH
jgi:hypothetical protein